MLNARRERASLRAREKNLELRSGTCKPSIEKLPAPAKLTGRRERRLLMLIERGAAVAEVCRALEISPQALYCRTRTDVFFAERLRAARAKELAQPVYWEEIAEQLERKNPELWALSEGRDS